MIDRKAWWSTTGGLYAVAAALVLLAMVIGSSASPPRRYQFASSKGYEVWRGDAFTGEAVLCVSSDFAKIVEDSTSTSEIKIETHGLMKKC